MPRLLTQGQLTPVCCVTDVSEELKDRFLLVNIDFADQLDHSFVFVDDPSTIYAEKNDVGENTSSQANPSFKNKSADECWLLLRQMREAGSNIDYESFVIIDDRTLQDDTVLVVVKELLTEDEAAQATNAEVQGDICEDVVMSQRHADGVLRDAYAQLTAEEEERLYGPFEDCTYERPPISRVETTSSTAPIYRSMACYKGD
ncbi:hypothetical protein MBLNU13_g01897t1 [Cladosporium sp. NU13]